LGGEKQCGFWEIQTLGLPVIFKQLVRGKAIMPDYFRANLFPLTNKLAYKLLMAKQFP
jgi:hypothetical protein